MDLEKKDIEHLAELARIELADGEEARILSDLKGILEYVEKLRAVDTDGVEPMAGGTLSVNECRSHDDKTLVSTPAEELSRAFPEREEDYLKVPCVFE